MTSRSPAFFERLLPLCARRHADTASELFRTHSMNLTLRHAALLAAALLTLPAAQAGEGHDHGDATPAPSGTALPRFTATSESFELVGVLRERQITLYLDRFADNSPVRGAQIELELGGTKFKAEALGADAYEVDLPEPPKPGVLPVTAFVTAGNESDLLAGELDLHGDEAAHVEATALSSPAFARWAAGGLAALAALAALAWAARRLQAARLARTGAAA